MSGRTSRVLALALAFAPGACAVRAPQPAAEDTGADAATFAWTAPDADAAAQRLATSPRHGEWVGIRTGDRDSVRAWVVYPERSTPAPVVLVVHEIYGLTNWIRAVADQLAADGFIAIAPDLLTMHDIPVESDGDPVRDQATAAIRTLDPAEYHRQLAAVGRWGMSLPAAAPHHGIIGFCWGGAAAFRHAIESAAPDAGVDAAVVYYGSAPEPDALAGVTAPVLGLYAGDDARVNTTLPPADSVMRQLGRPFDMHVFSGAGHGFLRQQDGREGANRAASLQAWPLTVEFLRRHLEAPPAP